MKKFTANELRKLWLDFCFEKGHKIIKSSSLIPENDASVLFTTAGMHPLVPYLLGEKHPMGKRIADVQKCLRTGDIDEVGDPYHLTFFEMLGNWSLGDYFKKEKVAWSYDFLTNPKYLGLKKEQIAVTVFGGNETIEKDEETATYWRQQGVPEERVHYLGFDENFWQINRGPCGPCSEMFLDTQKPKCSESCDPSCNCGKFMELGNDVYMQYNRVGDNEYLKSSQKNVDTGFGLERNLVIFNGVKSVYLTDCFTDSIALIEKLSGKKYNDDGDKFTKSFRIVADHVRAATAIIGDENGISPSNTDAGYVLRRLIRKSVRHSLILGIEKGGLSKIAKIYIEYFKDVYPEFKENEERIIKELTLEEERFLNTISAGTKEFEKVLNGIERHKEFALKNGQNVENIIGGKSAFRLYETFGFPIEMTVEMAKESGYKVDMEGYHEEYKKHQELARTTSSGHFKGGLADGGEETVKLHTAVHLLQAALRKVLGEGVFQKGSNITSERLRFDFSYDKPMTEEEIKTVEDLVNEAIKKAIPVTCEEMTVEQAKKSGALGVFENKYGEKVKVYAIDFVSKEICGGPHVKNTSELGTFKILKEQSSSSGVRRIKAILE